MNIDIEPICDDVILLVGQKKSEDVRLFDEVCRNSEAELEEIAVRRAVSIYGNGRGSPHIRPL